ncbi:MAG: metallophosphoesterase [candidate division WOR-3 bacterium]|nr:metallophosphoesterase [candidate division WOR-3 bacterium]
MRVFFLFIVLLHSVSAGAGDGALRFVVLGARTSEPVDGVFSDIIDQASLLSPDFVINVGNLVEAQGDDTASTRARWDDVTSIMSVLNCEFYFVPGSSDIIDEETRKIYEQETGCSRYYSFDYGNCHFIVLDNSITGWNSLQEADPEQYSWFVSDLEENNGAGHIFVLFHIPYYLNALSSGQPSPFVEQCLKYRVRAVFNGGLGSYMYLNEDGIDYIMVGSSGAVMQDNDGGKGNFYHFLYVTVKGDAYNVAVIKHGGVRYRNVFTGSDYYSVQRAQQEVVSFAGSMVREGEKNVSSRCQMTVSNTSTDSVTGSLVWEFDPARFVVNPEAIPLALGPEESEVCEIEVQISDGSQLYPLPRCVLEYPYTFGKVCTLNSVLSIRRVKTVEYVDSPPDIDGNLNDAAWRKLLPITHLGDDGGDLSSTEKTELYLGYDEDNVYVAVRCSESDTSNIRVSVQEHDGPTYRDDNVWFFFDVNHDQETYYQLIVNPDGMTFDRACSFTDGRVNSELEWNGPWEIISGREQNAWNLEIKIPKNEFAECSDERWGFNFRRLQTSTVSAAYWTLPFGHTPGNFGVIEFE